jgi:predicted Fe-Mo cluster-binding NifX family protein
MTETNTISIPVLDNAGAESRLSPHYARAPFHAVIDKASGRVIGMIESLPGQSGRTRIPLEAMKAAGVGAIVCRSLGKGAYNYLFDAGLSVQMCASQTLAQAIADIRSGALCDVSIPDLEAHEGVMRRKSGRKPGECCNGHEGHCEHGDDGRPHRCCEDDHDHDHGHEHQHGHGHSGCCGHGRCHGN